MKLSFIIDMLPFTSSTNTKMFAKRLFPQGRIRMKLYWYSICVTFLILDDFYINYIIRSHIFYKNDLIIMSGNTFSFRYNIRYRDIFDNYIFLFSFHQRFLSLNLTKYYYTVKLTINVCRFV